MPSTKEYKGKKRSKPSVTEAPHAPADPSEDLGESSKRRPGRGDAQAQPQAIPIVDVDNETQQEPMAPLEKEKVHITFPGSEVLRAKFPKPFDLAEAVATDWMADGKFEGLPVGHPLAQLLAQQSLLKAKQIEKSVLESPVTEKVAYQALTAAMKGQQFVQDIKEQIVKVKNQVRGSKGE
jgi:hypothetical protein